VQLTAVELADFRNIESALLQPHPRFNVLSGDNGQGKTNFLEAVYLLGTLRPLRAGRLTELVRFGAESARTSARVVRAKLERRYDVEVWGTPPRKQARVDGKAVRTAADYFGGFNVVLFAPDDLRLPRGAPSQRRRFLDRAVWNLESGYLDDARAYERVLKSRNALLREPSRPAHFDDLLEVYDEQLSTAGASLSARRGHYLRTLAPGLQEAYERITHAGVTVEARYQPSVPLPEGAEAAPILRAALAASRARDRAVGYTSLGPHADDIDLRLDGRAAGLYASQGQLRALVLSLKVAEITHLGATLGAAPILLLDDVSSELDPAKNRFLFQFLAEVGGQVFITTTDPAHVLLGAERQDYRVSGGRIALS